MPFAWATALSIGVVMKPAIASGSAPGKCVVMVTMPFSVFGYASTCNELNERIPTTRISRLTTLASTGRRMKMSVKFTASRDIRSAGAGCASSVGTMPLLIDDRCAVAQLQLPAGHDRLARWRPLSTAT